MSTVEEPEVRTWNFPRGTASVAVMTEFAGEHGVPAARMLAGTGLTERQLTDAETQIPAETELASYRALLDEVRRTLAEEMLAATPLSVDDIAIRLGYAEATPFIHAFKRWTGTTPAAHRRAHRRD
ncbi:helix-turn-helix domain-containing protein [Nocardia sp. NPDC059091]|uniref:helix-turn-helix domain-containing protein n=1 Tax=unclassified Nocardia TaxID=2637762 RepID=UPI00368351C6